VRGRRPRELLDLLGASCHQSRVVAQARDGLLRILNIGHVEVEHLPRAIELRPIQLDPGLARIVDAGAQAVVGELELLAVLAHRLDQLVHLGCGGSEHFRRSDAQGIMDLGHRDLE